ncbi:head-tail connector protein [Sphingomonas sp. MMS24-J13]|uniref:head-tail connector protein n=1 Tax=Sphingomonas sp. MMS24-J13 TaxID=3238686 RepID=UPI00384D2A58
MRTFVVTPPEPLMTWEEADDQLKLDGDEEQSTYVESLIAAATGHLDGPDGWLGRSIGPQTLETRFSLIGCASTICLPYPPVIDLVSVKYLDAAGIEQTSDIADFELYGDELAPVADWPWSGGSLRREAGRVRYRAGYETLPSAIRHSILLIVSDFFRFRETAAVAPGTVAKLPVFATVENLLAPFRKYA